MKDEIFHSRCLNFLRFAYGPNAEERWGCNDLQELWEAMPVESQQRIIDFVSAPLLGPPCAPPQGRLVDLRGHDANAYADFEYDDRPVRMNRVGGNGPEYETAMYEIRTVRTSHRPFLKPGDKVLFSRCVKVQELEPCQSEKEG